MKNDYSNLIAPSPRALSAAELPKIGDVLVGTYGYEARIAVFARVVGVTAASIKMVILDQKNTYTDTMDWLAEPILDNHSGAAFIKRFKTQPTSGYCVKYNSYTILHKWCGAPVRCYDYH